MPKKLATKVPRYHIVGSMTALMMNISFWIELFGELLNEVLAATGFMEILKQRAQQRLIFYPLSDSIKRPCKWESH